MIFLMLGIPLLFLGGCASRASAPTKFYILSPMVAAQPQKQEVTGEKCPSIGIGPVHLPAYLDRPQIVIRISSNELRLAEFDRWAEPLQTNVMGVLADNISRLLCTEDVFIYPWKKSSPIEYQVDIEILRMDGKLNGEVVLVAQWRIINPAIKSIILTKRSRYTESDAGIGYSTLVAAHSRLLGIFSKDIVESIRSLSH